MFQILRLYPYICWKIYNTNLEDSALIVALSSVSSVVIAHILQEKCKVELHE